VAFPTTSVLDDFNRADGALGSNWTAPMQAQQTPVVYTNAVSGAASDYSSAYWNVSAFGDDCETFMTIPAGATSHDGVYIHAKYRNVGTGTECGYTINYLAASGATVYRRYTNGWSGALATDATGVSPGDKCGVCVKKVGGDYVVEVWHAPVGTGIWGLEVSYTDTGAVATYPDLDGVGYSGFALWGSGNASLTRQIDDFGGGTVGGGAPVLPSDTPFPPLGRGATW